MMARARILAFAAVGVLAVAAPLRAAAPIDKPNFNDPEDALMAIQDLQTLVGILAKERGKQGYADQCDLAVQAIESPSSTWIDSTQWSGCSWSFSMS